MVKTVGIFNYWKTKNTNTTTQKLTKNQWTMKEIIFGARTWNFVKTTAAYVIKDSSIDSNDIDIGASEADGDGQWSWLNYLEVAVSVAAKGRLFAVVPSTKKQVW